MKTFKNLIFIFIFVCSGTTGLIFADVEPLPLDPSYAAKITESKGNYRSDTQTYKWKSFNYIWLENGLAGSYENLWDDLAEAYTMSKMVFEGQVNIVEIAPDKSNSLIRFAMIEEGVDYSIPIMLWVKPSHKAAKPLIIKSVVETKENTPHWFYEYCYKYRYTIKLTDGSIWLKETDSVWKKPWKEGAELIKIGTSLKPILINKNLTDAKSLHFVDANDYISDIQLLR